MYEVELSNSSVSRPQISVQEVELDRHHSAQVYEVEILGAEVRLSFVVSASYLLFYDQALMARCPL